MAASHFDLVIIGAGSGGFGAALASARLAVNVLLIEKSDWLGGNASRCGVNVWEIGVGGTGIPFDIYRRLKKIPHAVGIYTINRHICWVDPANGPVFPGAELLIDPTKRYLDTLTEFGAPKNYGERTFRQTNWHGVPFRCLLPREINNLAIACRGASFSSIGASSCSLSRTMMQLGQATGTAAAIAKQKQLTSFADVSSADLQTSLTAQHVELTWPRSEELLAYLRNEDA